MQEHTEDIKRCLEEIEGWEIREGKLVKSFIFKSFIQAVQFVYELAAIAEERNHHPIITIIQKTVKVSSVSFDVGHLTDKDFELAKGVDELYGNFREKARRTGNLVDEGDNILLKKEGEEKARKRTRGPYRKSSSVGL